VGRNLIFRMQEISLAKPILFFKLWNWNKNRSTLSRLARIARFGDKKID
jgi:hypothetical protein